MTPRMPATLGGASRSARGPPMSARTQPGWMGATSFFCCEAATCSTKASAIFVGPMTFTRKT